MAVRSTMAALIARERVLINDPAGASQVFDDQTIQDIMDESRQDFYNLSLIPKPTFAIGTISYLDYFSEFGGWEDDFVIKQFLTVVVTPATSEPIAGHFRFTVTTRPPLLITGKLFDVYRSAADLLERWAARYMTRFDFTSDAQSFKVSQVPVQLQKLAQTYRAYQRVGHLEVKRSDLDGKDRRVATGLGPLEIDYMASG